MISMPSPSCSNSMLMEWARSVDGGLAAVSRSLLNCETIRRSHWTNLSTDDAVESLSRVLTNATTTDQRKKREILPEPLGPLGGADLRFFSPQSDTSLHCRTTDTGLVHCTVCLFMSQLSLVLTAPTHEGMARLSWPGWLVTYEDGLGGHPSKY